MKEDFFKFKCPFCQTHIEAKELNAERQIKCPHCDGQIKIPDPAGSTAEIPKAKPPLPAERVDDPIEPKVIDPSS